VREELADLAPALADERDDNDVRGRPASDGAEERALAYSGASEEAYALPFGDREEPIDDPDARRKRHGDRTTRERVGRLPIHEDRDAA
jgi:hypothetical protein